jgi:glucosamine-6-phosphate deaminase
VASDQPHSCIGFGEREIVAPLNRAARPGRRIPAENLWFPLADAPGEYDERLRAAGGIDIFLLASGSSDGHVALNPVDAAASTTTRVVALEETTRRDNLSTFPTFRGIDDVPQYGVTVGIRTIRDLSKAVIMLALGEQKQEAVRRLGSAHAYDPSWPATVLSECRDPHFFIDRAAGALLETAS